MSEKKIQKTYDEINARIKAGEAVVVTAEEMVGIVEKMVRKGRQERSMSSQQEHLPPCVLPVCFLISVRWYQPLRPQKSG